MTASTTDRIEKKTVLHAPRARVWRALSDASEFGEWFQVQIDGAFVAGGHAAGHMTYPGYESMPFEIWVEHIEPESLFSFRWHPYAIEPDVDYSSEPTTLVEFRLADDAEGTLLTIVESGFDGIPLARRAKAFISNNEGWDTQTKAIEAYVSGA